MEFLRSAALRACHSDQLLIHYGSAAPGTVIPVSVFVRSHRGVSAHSFETLVLASGKNGLALAFVEAVLVDLLMV